MRQSESSGSFARLFMVLWAALMRELAEICWKRRRMRRRRLHVYSTYPKRTPGDLRAANRQDSIGAAVMAGPSISRIKKNIFFAPK